MSILLLLGGCGIKPDAISAPAFDTSSPAHSTSATIVTNSDAQSVDSDEAFSKAILQLVGAENQAVKEIMQGDCDARVTGMGAAELLYYEPYIAFTFSPETNVGKSYFKQGLAEGYQKENPLEDGLEVMWIHFMCDYDAASNQVENQESLRTFLKTEQEITYDFLCEATKQKPKLSHTESVYYLSPTQGSYNQQGHLIDGGVYTALYEIETIQFSISYIKNEEKYVALFAKLSV